ncbi:MAG TPA: 50S ribosomal protein L4 [Candidatus Dormibacteraeota bacterium]|jgi:large subunit ribosomal protein L4|nr:50S ribosomal protein L4 [Candidatus Saccharimonadales bacterium]HXJ75327.1 50S ribosomal protein L4 [Candidatus Dormibacteraeota bacterium]
MKLTLKDLNGNQQGEVEVGISLVEGGRGTQAVHDAVVAYRANQRMGTACTKTVGEVSGSNKKPWRQKGTGRARAGSHQSPLWAGGGVVFGPRPRSFRKKVNASTRQLAFRKALTERLKAGDVELVADLKLDSPKTKNFVELLSKMGLQGTVVLVDAAIDKNLSLASRNVASVEVTTAESLNTYQVLRPSKLVITRGALEKLEARLKD